MQAVSLPDCWGVDTSAKLNAATAHALASEPDIKFVWRYVFFGAPRTFDLTQAETEAILAAGLHLLVVQHVRRPPWTADVNLGAADGKAAVANAVAAGYPAGLLDATGRPLSLALDLEGVQNRGQAVFDHCKAWGQVVRDGGFSPVLYVGYSAGLTPTQLWQIPTIDRYWSDYGPRAVDRRGFCCKQALQSVVAGVGVDRDHAYPDALGGALTALAA